MKSSTFWTQIAKPASLLLVLTLGLSACGGDPAPNPTPNPEPNPNPPNPGQSGKILGQLKPWTTGDANKIMPVNAAVATPQDDFKADVTQDGKFDFSLPTADNIKVNYATDPRAFKELFFNCKDFQLSGDQDLKVITLNTLITDSGKEYHQKSNNVFLYWWYANKDAKVKFSGKECFVYGDVQNELTFKKGWNVIQRVEDNKLSKTNFKNIAQPTTRLDWSLASSNNLRAMSLPANFHYPWLSAEELQNR